ncbi:sensor histidine kinase, partial [Lysobacter sp. A3-1-A15]
VDGTGLRAQVSACTLAMGPRRRRVVLLADLTEGDRLAADLQAMARRLMTVQEDERRSLSRELHDDIGQSITAIKMCAMALADEDEARRLETIGEITGIADDTVAKLRNLSLLLRPPQLDALGLEAALRWQAGAMFRNGRPTVELDLDRLDSRPAHDVEQACFRIAQEAMTNAIRHADADRVVLRLRSSSDGLQLDVHDDGRGFDPQAARGLGLVTMRERAQQLGGDVWVEPAPEGGTRVRARLPLRTAEDVGAAVGDRY